MDHHPLFNASLSLTCTHTPPRRAGFNGCIFYDLELLTPFSDRIYFGGDILVLAGTARFTACAWFYTTIIGAENGVGEWGLLSLG